jgi:DnaJ-class molecular chaperone
MPTLQMARLTTCPACHGTGRIIWCYDGVNAKTCPWCAGTGATQPEPKGSFFMPKEGL